MVAATLFWSGGRHTQQQASTVNALLGDSSFVHHFGYMPTATTDEDLRIKTHLAYVEQLLRKKEISGLSAEQQAMRVHLLDLLHDYRTAGVFPRNYDYPGERVPCFIDKHGNICAVGYLIEQTAGRAIAEQINASHQYDYLLAINSEVVDAWVAGSGLSKEECAMIQPNYSGPPIDPNIALATALLGGANLSLNVINTLQIANGADSQLAPVLGLYTGTAALLLGLNDFIVEYNDPNLNASNASERTLAMLNVGLGTTTVMLSVWNLTVNKTRTSKTTAWNMYSYQTADQQTGVGLHWVKQF